MDDARWDRLGALVGAVLFAILTLVGGFIAGTPPELGDPGIKVAQFLEDHSDEIKIGVLLSGLAIGPALLWFASLWRTLRHAEGDVPRLTVAAAGGLFISGALFLTGVAILGMQASRVGALGPEQTRAFYDLSLGLQAAGGFALAILTGATTVIALRTRVFPLWSSVLGAAVTLGWYVASVSTVSGRSEFEVAGYVTFLLWLLWILVLGVLMYRRPTTT